MRPEVEEEEGRRGGKDGRGGGERGGGGGDGCMLNTTHTHRTRDGLLFTF